MSKQILFLALLFLAISCSESPEEAKDLIENTPYYPLDIGNYILYDVLEVSIYNNGFDRDTSRYQLREEVVDASTQDDRAFKIIEQYKRLTPNGPWNYDNRLTLEFIENQVVRTQNNLSIIVLALPIKANSTWSPTAFFDENITIPISSDEIDYFINWEGRYITTGATMDINDIIYNNVVTTELTNYENRLQFGYYTESYAPEVGLIHQKIEILRTQCFDQCQDNDWIDKVEIGHIIEKNIVESGND